MNKLTVAASFSTLIVPGLGTAVLPAMIARAGTPAAESYVEFMTAGIANVHTRRAYARAADGLSAWCESRGLVLAQLTPTLVAAWREQMARDGLSAPTIKLRLAAVRQLFDALVMAHVLPTNPAARTRGPKHSARVGSTPALTPAETRQLFDAIDATTPAGLRDRALIGLMVYSLARVGAALGMDAEDVYTKDRRLWVRLREKGGKRHEMPCHHTLETYLHAYMEGAGLAAEPKAPLFRTIQGRSGRLTGNRLAQSDAHQMIRRRMKAAGFPDSRAGNHTFRATGITAYLKNGGTLEKAAAMANHASTRTTQLYDRRSDEVSLDEIERILI